MSLQPSGLDLQYFRREQLATFDRRCAVYRDTGTGWLPVLVPPADGRPNCRVDTSTAQALPGDAQDASASSVQTWQVTLAWDATVDIGDRIEVEGSTEGPLTVGSDLSSGSPSYRSATRLQCTRQRVAVAGVLVTLNRRDLAGVVTSVAPQLFQVILSNYQPHASTTEAGTATYIQGTLIGAPAADVRVSDRFALAHPVAGAGEITDVRPNVDQTEAPFRLRVAG